MYKADVIELIQWGLALHDAHGLCVAVCAGLSYEELISSDVSGLILCTLMSGFKDEEDWIPSVIGESGVQELIASTIISDVPEETCAEFWATVSKMAISSSSMKTIYIKLLVKAVQTIERNERRRRYGNGNGNERDVSRRPPNPSITSILLVVLIQQIFASTDHPEESISPATAILRVAANDVMLLRDMMDTMKDSNRAKLETALRQAAQRDTK